MRFVGIKDSVNSSLSRIAVASGGDVNGDGTDDFLIGAPFTPGDPSFYMEGIQGGRTYLYYGGAASDPEQVTKSVAEADATIVGRWSELVGFSISPNGDYNGDGLADVLIGAPRGLTAGYVFYGRPVPEPTSGFLMASACCLAMGRWWS